ncbi:fumarylacetoacetate hydrolase family protein [Glaciibacter flavus]|uniref:Fumarylacetoacetate hydrolase family protein n=1 Tax=Orlajensenia flava TaxID=2565934 RepID=A0A4S4FPR4_9MICO|nr:fumarylacetoacetate hydrolase family protein [Glaciibacter flavus]THG32540.1 fumarylacetoacetate hydrolase family protein [Glaciibacter flavus]
MRLVSYREGGEHRLGVVDGDELIDVTAGVGERNQPGAVSPMRALLSREEPVAAFLEAFEGRRVPLDSVQLEPVIPDPGKVIAAPVNYRDHQAEMQEDFHIDALGVFLKAPSSVIASGQTVRLPYTDRRFDQEGELALVIGREARNVSVDEALDYVAGYTMLLDMTMRGGEDRSTRKSFDTFTPIGPFLVTPDEVGALDELQLRTWVNDDLRQDADIRDLIWGVPQLIAYASSVMTLRPGDVITTGTPAGVGQVVDGDRLTVEITGLGTLTAAVSSEDAVVCPTNGARRGPRPPEDVTPVRSR